MNLSNMKVGTRLGTGFAIVLLLVAVIAGTGSWRLNTISMTVTTLVEKAMQKERLFSEWAASTDINGVRTIAVAESADMDSPRINQLQTTISATSARISAIQKQLENMNHNPEEDALFAQVGAQRSVYVAARNSVFDAKENSPDVAEQLIKEKLEPSLKEYVAAISKLSDYQSMTISRMGKDSTQLAAQSQTLLTILGALAIFFGIIVAVLITRSIKLQLGGEPSEAVDIANRISTGDLTGRITLRNNDETSLLHALQLMQDNLADLVSQVRTGTDTIATASAEIASGNLDLSSRTEEQASSLEETASSMEELTSTVRQNADNARQANQLAMTASGVAVKGGEVVSQVVTTMGDINDSARRIVDIIAVIDGIAFQTNILALNAAVEAARAGEQGRGFAVVASEVRSLAQRSAAAAKEIKTLIDDSVGKVDHGSKLVVAAGSTMEEVVNSVKRVTDIMAEITAASQEQSSGIEQVNQAVGQMDQVTQQNAALVEEAAAAAESLQDQASNLAKIVSVFRINGVNTPVQQKTAPRAAPALTGSMGLARPAAKPKLSPTSAPAGRAVARHKATATTLAAGDDWEEF